MSLSRSRLISDIRTLCGELPDEPDGLPSNLVFQILCDVETEMLRDLDLSDQNRRVNPAPMEIELNSDEPFTVTKSDFNAPAYAFLEIDNIQYPVEIANHDSLLQKGIDGILALAFTGAPPKGFLSWTPDGNQTLKVYYDRTLNADQPLSGTTELGSLYDSYLKLQTAAQCRELLKMEVGEILKARLIKSERQWQKYSKSSRAQGLVQKSRVFTPPRYRRRYVGLDRTRFFVP